MSWPRRSASTIVSASAAASLKPRLRPCPAIGWMPCAASPASAKRGATKARASVRPERPGARLVLDADLAELQAEALLELGLEQERIAGYQPFGVGRPLGPYDRGSVAGQRQDGEWAGRQEMLLGAAIVRAFMRHRADDARLAVFPVDGLDAGHVAQPRFDAVGSDQQRVCKVMPSARCTVAAAPARPRTLRRPRPR